MTLDAGKLHCGWSLHLKESHSDVTDVDLWPWVRDNELVTALVSHVALYRRT